MDYPQSVGKMDDVIFDSSSIGDGYISVIGNFNMSFDKSVGNTQVHHEFPETETEF